MAATRTMTEIEILADVLRVRKGNLPPDVARSMLDWKFSPKANARMNRLATRSSEGKLSDRERDELDRFLRVGSLINIAQAQARRSLKTAKTG